MYKKVYIEITNNCNLNCDFCIKNSRVNKFMSTNEFTNILNKLKGHTKYLYFHLLGEPLLHPLINDFIDIASNDFFINITTNGYLINRIQEQKNIRQINISLHSYDPKYNILLEYYLNNIFNVIDNLKETTFISLRFWTKNQYTSSILDYLNKHYNINLHIEDNLDNITLENHVYLSTNEEFIWPDLDNEYYNENGSCLALKDHIGILVDGTIVPCCLDSKGCINLGNIYESNLDTIKTSERYLNMLKGFENNKKVELLCKKCPIKRNIKTHE